MSNITVYNPEPKTPYAQRREFDFYPTPLVLCYEAIRQCLPKDFSPRYILDPGAGDGVWGKAARVHYPDATINGVEIQPLMPPSAYDGWTQLSYLDMKPEGYDLIVGNPPYSLAEKFIHYSLSALHEGCYLLFLLRLAFLEGQARHKSLWIKTPPQQVFVLPKRPSFMPEGHAKAGKTDATAYAVYLWKKLPDGEAQPKTQLSWLDWS